MFYILEQVTSLNYMKAVFIIIYNAVSASRCV